jgi:predicted dehydrogenase
MKSLAVDVLVIGGGMIVYDQILPSLYHLQRVGQVGDISIVATSSARLKQLTEPRFADAFPGQTFLAYPALDRPEGERHPELWREVITKLPKQSLVIVATPDETHDEMVRAAIECHQHVLCVRTP